MIHLASNSQSRALLLNRFNIKFIQKAPEYDEELIQTKTAKDFAYIASKGKLESAIKEFGLETPLFSLRMESFYENQRVSTMPKEF